MSERSCSVFQLNGNNHVVTHTSMSISLSSIGSATRNRQDNQQHLYEGISRTEIVFDGVNLRDVQAVRNQGPAANHDLRKRAAPVPVRMAFVVKKCLLKLREEMTSNS